MKKTLALIMILSLALFAGCSGADSKQSSTDDVSSETQEDTSFDIDTEHESVSDDTDSNDVREETDKASGTLDTSYFGDLGASPEGIIASRGDMTEAIWGNGPLYTFGGAEIWYAFSEYDFTDNDTSYIPLGTCTQISIKLKDLIKDAKIYNADTFETVTGKTLSEEFDEMDELYVYSLRYDGYTMRIYANSRASVNGDSYVDIRKD